MAEGHLAHRRLAATKLRAIARWRRPRLQRLVGETLSCPRRTIEAPAHRSRCRRHARQPRDHQAAPTCTIREASAESCATYKRRDAEASAEPSASDEDVIRGFLASHTRKNDLLAFIQMAGIERPRTVEEVPFTVLVPAFVTSELKTAFQMGFIIFLPFLIIDLVVASILMSMGMMMLPPIVISLPFKLIFFVLVDGWALIIGSLAASYGI